MISYRLNQLGVTVSVGSTDPDVSARIQYDGDNSTLAAYYLQQSNGYYGHTVGSETTPIDLAVAMLSPEMQVLEPELITGAQIIENYKSPIPEGAFS